MERRRGLITAIKLDTEIGKLSGIGPKRCEAFGKLGIYTVKDLLYHLPRAYRNKGDVRLLAESVPDEVHSFLLTVAEPARTVRIKGRMTITKFRAFDESGTVTVIYFNQGYVDKCFTMGSVYRFYGKLTRGKHGLELNSPEHEAAYEGAELPDYSPLYPVCAGITQKIIKNALAFALDNIDFTKVCDPIPMEVRQKNRICGIAAALRNVHFPKDPEMLEAARKRFIFEELFLFALGMTRLSDKNARHNAPEMAYTDIEELYAALPYEPTGAQRRTVDEIMRDMTSKERKPMSRLVSGDVGCGKTLCACAAAYIAVRNGYQAALMAPTEILAVQHYGDISELMGKFGIRTELLTASSKAAKKREIYEKLEKGETDLIIGTHALLSDNVDFARLGLVITDEQHRFGVMQRAKLSAKTEGVHTLVMSATPIPRTLALILYGDLDISAVDEMPKGRQRVNTFVVDESYRERLNGFIRKQVSEGSQVYIVCPAIEAKEKDEDGFDGEDVISFDSLMREDKNMKSACEYAKYLCEETFPDLSVGLLHGKMKAAEKDAVMADFVSGKTDILVSTTVIEVGVNVPNATLMIVENAERFGLSQLHQLRGRVGRGTKKSYCILVSDSDSESSKERLETMHTTYDGYLIAQKDLEMRGPGDFLPSKNGNTRQSGTDGFKYGALCDNMDMLKSVFDTAKLICSGELPLSEKEAKALDEAASNSFENMRGTIS